MKPVSCASAVALSLLLIAPHAANAANSDQCEHLKNLITSGTAAELRHRDPTYNNYFLRHPAAETFVVYCTNDYPAAIRLSWDTGRAPERFFNLVGLTMKSAYDVDANKSADIAHSCLSRALKVGDAVTSKIGKISIECSAFKGTEGGDSVEIHQE